jgi:hypothetical protein
MAVHRNRVIYQSEALFISPDSTGYHYTGAYGPVVDAAGATHNAHWGLMTPPIDSHQVIGAQKNGKGQSAGWNCADGASAWPEWDPEGNSGTKATYGGGGDMDNLTEDYTFEGQVADASINGITTPAANGADNVLAIANAAGLDILSGDPTHIPDAGEQFTINGDGVNNVDSTASHQGVLFEAFVAGAAGDDVVIEFVQDAGGLAFSEDVPSRTVTINFNGEDYNALVAGLTGAGLTLIKSSVVLNGNGGVVIVASTIGSPPTTGDASGVPGVTAVKPTAQATLEVISKGGTATLVAVLPGTQGNVSLPVGNDVKSLRDLVIEHNLTAGVGEEIEVPAVGSPADLEKPNVAEVISLTSGKIAYAKAHGSIIKQLKRVQSANYGFTVARQDVNQFGHASRLDSIVVESPTVNLDFSYYLLEGYNERMLEFVTDGQTNALSGLLTPELYQAGNNFFILTAPEARDAVVGDVGLHNDGKEDQKSVIALGNGYITDYSVDISVGSIPTASITVEGMNIRSDFGTTGNDIPAVNMKNGARSSDAWTVDANGTRSCNVTDGCTGLYSLPPSNSGYTGCNTDGSDGSIAALRPGDVLVDLNSKSLISKSVAGNSDTPLIGSSHIQSASISLPLGRTTLQRLGSVFGFSKAIDLPLSVSMSFNAIVADLKEGNMLDLLCDCEEFDVGVTIFKPECAGCTVKDINDGSKVALRYTMKGAKLESETFSSTIGDNKSVDLSFTTQVGSSDDMKRGLYIEGSEDAGSAAIAGVPPAWTGVDGSTIDPIDGYLFGYRK